MHKHNKYLGVAGIIGIWLTAGSTQPLINFFDVLTAEQLMVFRGGVTALLAFICLRGKIWQADRYTYLLGLVVPFATLGLYQGSRHWGVSPTIIILTATPLVNLLINYVVGRSISRVAVIGFVLTLLGVILARKGGVWEWTGFAWSAFGTILNAIFYELLNKTTTKSMFTKCFWAMSGMTLLGLLLSTQASWTVAADWRLLLALVAFAFVGGFLYWLANMVAFDNLPTFEASVLVQGETPAVIIGSTLLLGEHLTLIQWCGVLVSITGAWVITRSLPKPV